MDQIVVVLAILAGIGTIIASFIMNDKGQEQEGKQESKVDVQQQLHRQEEENLDRKQEQSLRELNQKILELHDYASFVKEEITDKHKELLFLYQLISEKEKKVESLSTKVTHESNKKKDVSDAYKKVDGKNQSHNLRLEPKEQDRERQKLMARNPEVFQLYHEGLSVKDIAKKLNIGQGEVSLIIDIATK